MSEDTIDAYLGRLITYLETHPLALSHDEGFDEISEMTHDFFSQYLTKERNYN